jgi:hypothetical protein
MHLPLISEDEYVNLFPDPKHLSEEELMPRRIEYEKLEREKMEQERLDLEKIKEGLIKENVRKKEELRQMDEKLEATIEQLKPIQEVLMKDI